MAPVYEITFQEALSRTAGRRREILLGNGFSIAAHSGFLYDRLMEQADLPPEALGIFASKRTTNFEEVMQTLLAEMAGKTESERAKDRVLIEQLKDALVGAIHKVHPRRPWDVGRDRLQHCQRFLAHFIGNQRQPRGRVFTTNYDLLLTWVTAPDADENHKSRVLYAFDGFRQQQYQGLGAATVVYLHGALHLHGSGKNVWKLTYKDTGKALHEQIADFLGQGIYPLVVTEGASTLKKPRGDSFRRDAWQAFRGATRGASDAALFTLGHGLGREDDHLLGLIGVGTVSEVYLGAYDAREVRAFQAIGEDWIRTRASANKPPLTVYIYPTDGLAWGPSPT